MTKREKLPTAGRGTVVKMEPFVAEMSKYPPGLQRMKRTVPLSPRSGSVAITVVTRPPTGCVVSMVTGFSSTVTKGALSFTS